MTGKRQSVWRCAVVCYTLVACVSSTRGDDLEKSCPSGLRPGDTIALVAPARNVNRAALERVTQRLQALGYRVKFAEDIERRYGYLAGSDERRAAELMQAFEDPEVDAVFPFTGGYGTTRLLDRLDYDIIAAHPKILIGFSDITGLHLALQAKTQLITFHAPNADGGWGREAGMNAYAERWLWRCLEKAQNRDTAEGFSYELPEGHGPLQVLQAGKARGRLTGGNLSLVASLMGTPYEIQTEGRVLFLEDVHEAPYRVDRMLSQLRLGGKLRSPAAVVLGQFTDTGDEDDRGLSMDQVLRDYFANAPYPVIANFPAGHVAENATLPMGAEVELDTERSVLRVLQAPVK